MSPVGSYGTPAASMSADRSPPNGSPVPVAMASYRGRHGGCKPLRCSGGGGTKVSVLFPRSADSAGTQQRLTLTSGAVHMEMRTRLGLLVAALTCIAAAPAAAQAKLPAGVTPAMITKGKTIFTSTGLCFACHGMDAKGHGRTEPHRPDLDPRQGHRIPRSSRSSRPASRSPRPRPARAPCPRRAARRSARTT